MYLNGTKLHHYTDRAVTMWLDMNTGLSTLFRSHTTVFFAFELECKKTCNIQYKIKSGLNSSENQFLFTDFGLEG